MAKRFRQAFIDRLNQTGETVAQVARATGVSVEQLKKMRQRESASTNVDDGLKIAHHFGLSLDEFLGDTTVQDRNEMIGLYSRLSAAEQAFLLDVARARAALGREEG